MTNSNANFGCTGMQKRVKTPTADQVKDLKQHFQETKRKATTKQLHFLLAPDRGDTPCSEIQPKVDHDVERQQAACSKKIAGIFELL